MDKIIYEVLPKNREDVFVGFHLGGHKIKDGFKRWAITKIVRVFSRPTVILSNGKKIKVTHTELVFPPEYLENGIDNNRQALSFSSNGLEGGVRYKAIDYKKHPERWVFIKVNALNRQAIAELYGYTSLKIGCPYDFAGVVLYFGVRFFKREDPKKWWCSEIDSNRLWGKPDKISPAKMFKILYKYMKNRILETDERKKCKCATLKQFHNGFQEWRKK